MMVGVGWRRRAQERRAIAELRRDLDSPDLDPAGLEPSRHHLDGGLPDPASYAALPGPGARARRTRGPLLPGLLVVVALLGFVVLSNPGSASYWAGEAYRRATGASSTTYAFMSTRTATGEPVAWDPCRPIAYQVNPVGAPPGWEGLVREAIADLEAAGGFRFVDEGVTAERDFLERPPTSPVLIGWGRPSEFEELSGDVAGFGGASSLQVAGLRRYVTGAVLLDSGDYGEMATIGRQDAMRLILVHELLHVLGLDHVEDRRQLMATSYLDQDGLGAGDRAGLARLADQPCA